jgi:RimJ/RimL family protein N-acetyltransferase
MLSHYQLRLRDGLSVILRPLVSEDRERVIDAFKRLSPESTYLRFWTRFREVTPTFIEGLCADDPNRHASWIIVLKNNGDIPGVGGASFWRSGEDESLAEVSFTVADEFQGQGAGTILLAALWEHAFASGIRRFVAHVLESNHVMLTWWSSLGAVVIQHPLGSEMTLMLDETTLPETSTADSLRHWLAFLRAAIPDAPEKE